MLIALQIAFLCLVSTFYAKETSTRAMHEATRANNAFSYHVENETRTGWSIVVLKYEDPKEPTKNLEAHIAPDAGSNLYSLKVGGTELLVQPPELSLLPGSRYGFPILYPTPNRVRDSRFTFDGVTYSFPPNNGKNFIHGLAHSLKWEAGTPSADADGAKVTTSVDWNPDLPAYKLFPFVHRVNMTYTLDRQGVRIEFSVQNQDQKRLPFGFGFHPWFQILGNRAETYFYVPARKHMEMADLLPTGKLANLDGKPYDLRRPVSLESLKVDDVFWGMSPDKPPSYESRDKGIKVTLAASREFTHMVVYTPPGKPFFCMENQTCSTDAHNLFAKGFKKEAHLLIAEKGKTVSGWVRVKVERLLPRRDR